MCESGAAMGAKVTVERINYVPGAVLSPEAVAVARKAIVEELGEKLLAEPQPSSGGDDFHYFAPALGCKSTYLGVGANVRPSLHHPEMEFEAAALDNGARVLARIVLDRLGDEEAL